MGRRYAIAGALAGVAALATAGVLAATPADNQYGTSCGTLPYAGCVLTVTPRFTVINAPNTGTRSVTLHEHLNLPSNGTVTVRYRTVSSGLFYVPRVGRVRAHYVRANTQRAAFVAVSRTLTFGPGVQDQTVTITINRGTFNGQRFIELLSNPVAPGFASYGTRVAGIEIVSHHR